MASKNNTTSSAPGFQVKMRFLNFGLRVLDSLLFRKDEKQSAKLNTEPTVEMTVSGDGSSSSSANSTPSTTSPLTIFARRLSIQPNAERSVVLKASAKWNEPTGITEPIFEMALPRLAVPRRSTSGHQPIGAKRKSLISRVLNRLSNRQDSAKLSDENQSVTRPEPAKDEQGSRVSALSMMSDDSDGGVDIADCYDGEDAPFGCDETAYHHDGEENASSSECEIKELFDSKLSDEAYVPFINGNPEPVRSFGDIHNDPSESINGFRYFMVLVEHIPALSQLNACDFVLGPKSSGSFHVVQFVGVLRGPYRGKYVIKMPRTGDEFHWSEEDAHMLSGEAETMMLIQDKTECPIPEVLGYNAYLENDPPGHHNILNVPYILMRAIEGVPSHHMWFNYDAEGYYIEDHQLSWQELENTKKRRANFIESLAHAMGSLKKISLRRTGIIRKDSASDAIEMTNSYKWWFREADHHSQVLAITPTFETENSFWTHVLDKMYGVPAITAPKEEYTKAWGHRMFMNLVLRSKVFNETRIDGKNFVLRHEDLDFQNILCDPKTGMVTGIIDWDNCRAVPRSIGYASLPLFLIRDWHPNFEFQQGEIHGKDLPTYRKMYADAMHRAIGDYNDDAKYTLKSCIFQGINSSLYGSSLGNRNIHDILHRLFAASDYLHMLPEDNSISRIGQEVLGQQQAHLTRMVSWALEKLMACE